jgi:hypothetical protein
MHIQRFGATFASIDLADTKFDRLHLKLFMDHHFSQTLDMFKERMYTHAYE